MSWGRPKCASIRLPSRASRTTCASVSAGRPCRSGSIASVRVPPAARPGGEPLGGHRPGDDPAVAHLVDVGVDQAGDQRLTEPEAGLHRDERAVGRDGVRREEDAGGVREDHPLHDDGHGGLAGVGAGAQAVGHGPFGVQRGPAAADVLEDRGRTRDVQVRVLLAGEGGGRQVLRRRARPDGVRGVLAVRGEREGDGGRHVVRDGDRLDGPADLRAQRADPLPVVRVQARQRVELSPIDGAPRGSAGRRPSSRRSRPARGCRRCARARRGARPCRRPARPASRRSPRDPPRILVPIAFAPHVACGERVWSTPRGLKQAPLAAIIWLWRGFSASDQESRSARSTPRVAWRA